MDVPVSFLCHLSRRDASAYMQVLIRGGVHVKSGELRCAATASISSDPPPPEGQKITRCVGRGDECQMWRGSVQRYGGLANKMSFPADCSCLAENLLQPEMSNLNTRLRLPECSVFLEIEYWGGILNTRV